MPKPNKQFKTTHLPTNSLNETPEPAQIGDPEMMDKQPDRKPQRKLKHLKKFTHELYYLRVGVYKKNEGWKKFEPRIVPTEHSHKFHSVDGKTGKPQKDCTPSVGHFHEVNLDWDTTVTKTLTDTTTGAEYEYDGPAFTCGPPVRFVEKRLRGPKRRAIQTRQPVIWWTEDEDGEHKHIDTHTHFVEYIHEEELTPAGVQAGIDDNRAKIKSMMGNSMSSVAAANLALSQGKYTNAKDAGNAA